MKFLSPQLAQLVSRRDAKRKRATLFRFLTLLGTAIAVYSFLFHVLMAHEGQDHSWLTGLYWTLTVMSTLGFGDITFHSDPGRVFSIVVLLSGIALLLIVGPLVLIQTVAGPWLEDQLRHQAPRNVATETADHVIVCQFDEVATALGESLRELEIPYFIIEPDAVKAAGLYAEDVPVVAGERDAEATYDAMRVDRARVVVTNLSDPENSNVALTIRQTHPDVPIVAFAEELDSVDVLELSGANEVLPLKIRLGESLATRVTAGTAHAHPVGRFKNLMIVEFPMEHTGLAGRTILDTNLRKLTGLNIVACWEGGRLLPARPNTVLGEHSVLVLVGTSDQIAELDAMFAIYHPNENPVIVIGGGKVGQATVRALSRRGVSVCMIERDEALRPTLEGLSHRLLIGDATDRKVMTQAGLDQAPCVVLTTNDDAINIFLAVYCRRLAPDVHIVSRITGLRNLEAIHRAGADQVLSETTLAVRAILDRVRGAETSIMAEGVDLVVEPVPNILDGKRLDESKIADLTGLNVIALQRQDGSIISPQAGTRLQSDHELVMLGSRDQRESFREQFS